MLSTYWLHSAFYPWYANCILLPVRSLRSRVFSLRFTLTANETKHVMLCINASSLDLTLPEFMKRQHIEYLIPYF